MPAQADLENRAPVLAPLPDAGNSATQFEVRIRPVATDPDDDVLALAAVSADPSVATASFDKATGEVVLVPVARGETVVTVTASDGATTVARDFRFTVDDVTRTAALAAAPGESIVLLNATSGPATFALAHNGFRNYQSTAEMLEEIEAMPAQVAGETFERKLWRFVRENAWHDIPLSEATWLSNPAVLVNSLGWGFCHNVAGAYVELARVAGREARIWGLNGHVVPEIRVAAGWQMYDPDLAVYYHDATGAVASVAALAADPSLVTAPVAPVLPAGADAYGDYVAGIYGSAGDNFIGVEGFLAPADGPAGAITLPAGATLTYPGRWTGPPVTNVTSPPTVIDAYEQAALGLPAGWTGPLDLPWVLWDVTGDGAVAIDGLAYDAGSSALRARLRGLAAPPTALTVTRAEGALRLVFLVNPLRHEVKADNTVALTGLEVWRVQAGTTLLPEAERPGPAFPGSRRKPAP